MARSRKKKKLISSLNIKLMVAAGAVLVFLAAFAFYFVSSFSVTEREYAVYSSMEEPTLPVVYTEVNGYKINTMHGYIQDLGNKAAPEFITPLPENRKLELSMRLFGNSIAGLKYEIRSLDMSHFIEKTEVDSFSKKENGDVVAVLPIQNMINKDTPYLMKIELDLGERLVNYYTRIIWSDSDNINRMIEAAAQFTQKTFDYDSARDLTIYLETDAAADNSSLGTVHLNSSFSQITWGSTGMKPTSELNLVVRQYDGMMGAVEVSYTSESPSDSERGDRYFNVDEFSMKAGTDRIYMMNFERKTNQIFEGNKHVFAGRRIGLGITNTEALQTKKSESGQHLAFKVNRELWTYDQIGKKAVNVFSFRSETDHVRADYDKHDIKILSVDDNGTIDFVVYGYMNRGRHEGYNGIVCYRYNSENQTTSEIFFIPVANSYENIRREIEELCTKSSTGMLYVKQNDAVTAIDLTSLEMLDVVANLNDGRYAISRDQSQIAWLEGNRYAKNSIKMMDLMSANTQTITAEDGEILTLVSFYNQDLIYGISGEEDRWIINGRMQGLPMHTIRIVNSELAQKMEYRKNGLYFAEITQDNDRIHIVQYRKSSTLDHSYTFASRDTIVSNEPAENLNTKYITTDGSENKKKVFFLELDENIKTTRTLSVNAPKNLSYENSGTLELGAHKATGGMRYYAYKNGRLVDVAYSLETAIDLCYDEMGWVEDANAVVLYSRADRGTARTVSQTEKAAEPLVNALADFTGEDLITEEGYAIMNAQGIPLNRLMYYISKGCPIVAYLKDGEYCLIYGYTADSVAILYPGKEASDDGEGEIAARTENMALEEAAIYFDRYQNDFIAARKYLGH